MEHKHRGRSSTVVWPLPHHLRDMTVSLGIRYIVVYHYRHTTIEKSEACNEK
jgi:hypothetical protein